MTAEDFRNLALSFPETVEHQHMNHPDFRVRGKIFATLGYPDDAHGMVKLTPEQQHEYIKSEPNVFTPSKGAWGPERQHHRKAQSSQEDYAAAGHGRRLG